MLKLGRDSIHYSELFVAVVIFINIIGPFADLPFLSFGILLTNFFMTVFIFSFALVYILFDSEGSKKSRKMRSRVLHLLFAGIMLAYAASVLFLSPMSPFEYLSSISQALMIFILFFLAFLPILFLTFLGAYAYRDSRTNAALLLLAALVIILLLFNFKALITSFRVDDEEMLVFQGVVSLMHGANPYNVSYSDALYQNPKVGFTITTGNSIIGIMDYPALSFLVLVPFYLIAQPTLESFENAMLPLQASVFIFLLFVSLAFALKRKDLVKPKFVLLAFLIMAMLNISSINTYLMIALLMIAYAKLDSKYVWIVLGLGASIQEQLWLPILFLIAYSINNQGIKRGIANALGAVAVFLAVNAYFILQSPVLFFGSIFMALKGFFLPNGTSGIGFVLVKEFPVLLSTYAQLFELTSVFLVFLLLYWNRKELIPLFSMVPFIMSNRSISSYYATFFFVLIFAFTLRGSKEAGWVEKWLRHNRFVVYAIVAAFAVAFIALILSSHAAYARNFNITSSNARLIIDSANSTSIYKATISYSGLSNGTVYAYAIALDSRSKLFMAGFLNYSLIPGAEPKCGSYDCLLNINEIRLPQNRSSYELTARIDWLDKTRPVEHAAIQLYNGAYFFSGSEAHNTST